MHTDNRTSDLALFNLAIDSKLRGCDLALGRTVLPVGAQVASMASSHPRLCWFAFSLRTNSCRCDLNQPAELAELTNLPLGPDCAGWLPVGRGIDNSGRRQSGAVLASQCDRLPIVAQTVAFPLPLEVSHVAPKPPHRKTPSEMIADVQKDQQRQNNRTLWMLRLGKFQDDVMAKAENWQIAARNIGSAYKLASESHKKTLADQSSSDALNNQILFTILTLATVASISWVSSTQQAKVAKAMETLGKDAGPRLALIEAVEDMAKTGAGAVLGNVMPVIKAPNYNPMNQDPQVYQNDLENSISAVRKEVFTAFGKIKADASNAPLSAWDNYDESEQVALHKKWQNMASKIPGAEDLPSIQLMSDELERGIWKHYVLEQHSHLDFGLFETEESFDFIGYFVYKRLDELGAVKMPLGPDRKPIPEGLMNPGLIGPNKVDIDIPVTWAKSYQVKDLVAYGKTLAGKK
jgi:hypothetical protein